MEKPIGGRIAELTAPRVLTIRDQTFRPPSPGYVLVRVTHVGICASDLAAWRAGPGKRAAPVHLGHEPVGVVHMLGSGVTGLRVGQPVTGRLVPSFADYVEAPANHVVAIPDTVDPAVALGEPLGCIVEGYRRATPSVGDRTAVIGLGFMGLVMTQLLARSPVTTVVAVDPRADALATATMCGATVTYRADSAATAEIEADLVVEASGTQAGLNLASAIVAEHGTLSILGYHQASSRDVDVQLWNWKALDVVNAHVRDEQLLVRATRAALDLLAAGRLDVAPLLTHCFPIEQLDEAFQALEAKPAGFHKAVVVLNGPGSADE